MLIDRIRAFRRRLERAAADRVLHLRQGVAILGDAIPDVYDHNYVTVDAPRADAAELAAEADEALAERHHRRVVVDGGGAGLADGFAGVGYGLSTHLVLAHTRAPDRLADTGAVREVELDDLLAARTEATLREPWGDAELAEQLNEAKRRVGRAVPTRFYAAACDGEVAGWCELRVGDGVAQIEDVEVLAEFRGRGLGRALVQHALVEGMREADIVFLEALADDWPRELYAKLGFTAVGRRDVYTRLPPPTTRLRLRTPALELRVPTAAELRLLGGSVPDGLTLVAREEGRVVGFQRLILGPPDVRTETLQAADERVAAQMRDALLAFAARDLGAEIANPPAVPVDVAGLEHAMPMVDGKRALT